MVLNAGCSVRLVIVIVILMLLWEVLSTMFTYQISFLLPTIHSPQSSQGGLLNMYIRQCPIYIKTFQRHLANKPSCGLSESCPTPRLYFLLSPGIPSCSFSNTSNPLLSQDLCISSSLWLKHSSLHIFTRLLPSHHLTHLFR